MPPRAKRIGFAVIAVLASVLSVYAAFVIFNMLFLFPDDPAKTQAQNIGIRLEFIAGAAVFLVAFAFLSSWAFKKLRQYLTSK
jgi:hypothetical protein